MTVRTRIRGATRTVRGWLLTGAVLTVPLVVTVLVLGVVANFLLNVVSPVVAVVRIVPGISPLAEGVLVRLLGLLSVLVVIGGIGAVADATEADYAPRFDAAIERIPGVGDLYRTFRRMGDTFADGDVDTFREVKLVEFPHEDTYSVAFVTADTPDLIQASVEERRMQTLFVPLAPNPVMGGFLVHVAADQVYDVDLTVEEAVQSIVTSGVSVEAIDRDADRPPTMADFGDTVDEEFDGVDGDPPKE